MGCLEKLPYEVILRQVSFKECREYIRRHFSEKYDVQPGYRIFDIYLIGVPPIAIGVDGNDIIFPYTKPCYGTFLVRVNNAREEIERLRSGNQ